MELTIRDNRNSKDYRMYNSCLNLNAYFAMRFIKNNCIKSIRRILF